MSDKAIGEKESVAVYELEEAKKQSLEYFMGDSLAADVFFKYALADENGKILEPTPEHMHRRLAKEFARIDKKYNPSSKTEEIYFDALRNFSRIVPQGSPMAAIGNNYQKISTSNCVVIDSPKDSIGGIFESARELAELFKRRCGVGINISTLRPEGTLVNNAAKTTTGACSFADFYSFITRLIGQNNRRGALMISMSVHHPDVEKFATIKHNLEKVTGANISIQLTDEFLAAVKNNKTYKQYWPTKENPSVVKEVKAKDVWKTIISSATKTAEPGLLFWDTICNNLPANCYFPTICTNPCGELPLAKKDSCRLISINLTGYIRNAFEPNAFFDFELFENDIRLATKMSDNLVDLELELVEKIISVCGDEFEKNLWKEFHEVGLAGRRVGLGTHGLADTLAQLCKKYDSEESLEIVNKIYKTLRDVSYKTSVELAKERGPFTAFDWEKEKDCLYIKRLPEELQKDIQKHGRRNVSLLTQAPTGSISIISKCGESNSFNVSSGVEPVFRNSYTRRRKLTDTESSLKPDFIDQLGDRWQEYKIYHSNVKNYMKKFGISDEKDLPEFFVTSDKIDWHYRIRIQATEQQYIDHSISNTINLPKGTSEETVSKIYMEAWEAGLKGVTIYVDGSREGVLLSNDSSPSSEKKEKFAGGRSAPKRPKELPCEVFQTTVQGEKWTIFVGLLDGKPYEVMGGLSKNILLPRRVKTGKILKFNGAENPTARYDFIYDFEKGPEEEATIRDISNIFDNTTHAAFTRMISLSLRHFVPVCFLVEQMTKGADKDNENIYGFSRAMARVLKNYIEDGTRVRSDKFCPSCKQDTLIYKEGCVSCSACSYTKCG